MIDSTHAPRQQVKELLIALHARFGDNLEISISAPPSLKLEAIDLKSRIISELKTTLVNINTHDLHKKNCAEILDEVFSDFAISMYLNSIGLIVPARMCIRRAFELGLATVYMWDLPHEYWGWKTKDQDLSFTAMITHLNSPGYLEFLKQLRGSGPVQTFCVSNELQPIYRTLSNTVHGKFSDLPALSPQRFSTNTNDLELQLDLILAAQSAVINLLLGRFPDLYEKILEVFPHFSRASS